MLRGQPCLHSKFEASLGYKPRPCVFIGKSLAGIRLRVGLSFNTQASYLNDLQSVHSSGIVIVTGRCVQPVDLIQLHLQNSCATTLSSVKVMLRNYAVRLFYFLFFWIQVSIM